MYNKIIRNEEDPDEEKEYAIADRSRSGLLYFLKKVLDKDAFMC